MSVIKLNWPLNLGTEGNGVYPITTADQIIKADGSRLEDDNGISVNHAINADTLGGFNINYFVNCTHISDENRTGEELAKTYVENMTINKLEYLTTWGSDRNAMWICGTYNYPNCGFLIKIFYDGKPELYTLQLNNGVWSNAPGFVLTDTVPFKFGIDANGNYGYIKDGADTVIPFNKNFYVTNSILDKGTFKGTTSKLTSQYNNSVGFSGTGTVSSVTSTSYIGWQYELDLTNYKYIMFAHKKVTNHGQATILVDDTRIFANNYENLNTAWYLAAADIGAYTGIHKVTFHCGYVDSSGSASSNSYFSNICFVGNYEPLDWNI